MAIHYLSIPSDEGTLRCPTFKCDACGDKITGHGNLYRVKLPDGTALPEFWHAHKACGGLLNQLEEQHGGKVLWADLSEWLDELRVNLHMTEDEMRSICGPPCETCGVPECVCDYCDRCEVNVNPYTHFTEWSATGLHPSEVAMRAAGRGDEDVTERMFSSLTEGGGGE